MSTFKARKTNGLNGKPYNELAFYEEIATVCACKIRLRAGGAGRVVFPKEDAVVGK